MGKLRPLTESPRYEDFIKQRDTALEKILTKYLHQVTGIVNALQTRSEEIASHIGTKAMGREHAKSNRSQFEQRLAPFFDLAAMRATALVKSLRRTTYALSYLGQAEAIGRALGKTQKAPITKQDIDQHSHKKTSLGSKIDFHVDLIFHRLLRDVVDAYQMSQAQESPIEETLARIRRAFPSSKKVKKVRAPMAKMQEAGKLKNETEYQQLTIKSTGMTESEWQDILDDYLDKEIPEDRAPYSTIFAPATDEGPEVEVYEWQFEGDVTNEFVQSVRDGENDAANENGINDFQWIAIIDKVTDECCSSRDGMTTTEIEAALASGDLDADLCDAVTPAAHPWCRCRVAPMTDDMPDVPPSDQGSYDDWLNNVAA